MEIIPGHVDDQAASRGGSAASEVATRSTEGVDPVTVVAAGELRPSAFRARYVRCRRPVILTGVVTPEQRDGWDPDGLARRVGTVPVRLSDGTDTTIGRFVERLPSLDEVEEPPIVANVWLRRLGSEAVDRFIVPAHFTANWLRSPLLRPLLLPNWAYWVEFFLGPPGGRYPVIHFDTYMTHAWSLQMHGQKRFWLWPPYERQPLWAHMADVDRASRDLDGVFPHARPTTLVLNPGEVLFVPAGWWHTTRIVTTSVTLSGNFVDDSNWHDFVAASQLLCLATGRPWRRRSWSVARLTAPALRRTMS